jgi:hypothetical protein
VRRKIATGAQLNFAACVLLLSMTDLAEMVDGHVGHAHRYQTCSVDAVRDRRVFFVRFLRLERCPAGALLWWVRVAGQQTLSEAAPTRA